MGLLDEAIREHLELKRRHGADPTEVARQESEALGPARRAAEPAVAEPDDEAEFVEEPEPVAFEPAPAPEPAVSEPEPPRAEPEPEPQAEPEPTARRIDPDLVDQPTVEHPAARPEPLIEDEIFDVYEPPAPAEEDGDVLEATPEFLEETPEHDRLWFEQRPPRDFNFDD